MNTFTVSSIGEDNQIEITFSVEEKNDRYNTKFEYKFSDSYTKLEAKITMMKQLDLYINEQFYSGDTICKNELSEKLISYMLLSDEELNKISGRTYVKCYRLILIHMIKLLWQ